MPKSYEKLTETGSQGVLADRRAKHVEALGVFVSRLEGLPIKGPFSQDDVDRVAKQAAKVGGPPRYSRTPTWRSAC